jgi:hypothetical protein
MIVEIGAPDTISIAILSSLEPLLLRMAPSASEFVASKLSLPQPPLYKYIL